MSDMGILHAQTFGWRDTVRELEAAIKEKDATIASLRSELLNWDIARSARDRTFDDLRKQIETLKLAITDVLDSARYNEAMGIEIDEATLQHLAAVIGEEWPR